MAGGTPQLTVTADAVRGALGEIFGQGVILGDTLVAHHERMVVGATLPDGMRAVVKANVDASGASTEAAVLQAAGAAGVPVPRVLGFAAGPPSILALERLEGEWLSPDRPAAAWRSVGTALRRLHSVSVPGLRTSERDFEELAGRAVRFGVEQNVIDQIAAGMAALAADCAPVFGTLHGDCAPIHVRLDGADQMVGFLDLGDAGWGDPAYDLTVLTLRSPDKLGPVLDGYMASDEFRRWMIRAYPVYRALRHLGEAVWLADHGYNPRKAVREATAAAAAMASH